MNIEQCNPQNVSDEMLNAFVDDELDAADKSRLLNCMAKEAGAKVRDRICQIWQVRELVRSACPQNNTLQQSPVKVTSFKQYSHLLFGGLLLALALATGWILHGHQKPVVINNMVTTHRVEEKVLLHLTSSNHKLFNIALEETEALSHGVDLAGNPVQVELLVDRGGLDLLRSSVSPYAARIKAMSAQHNNITFLACNNTIQKLRKTGANVQLLPYVAVVPSAKELIVARVQEGWTYLKV